MYRSGPRLQTLRFGYETAGLVVRDEPIPWNADSVLVEAVLTRVPAASRKTDFRLRLAGQTATAEFGRPQAEGEHRLLFAVLEFGLVWALSRPRAEDPGWRAVWWIAGASLLVIPLCRVGEYNDFAMRASIPALFALWIGAGRALFDPATGRRRRTALAVLLAVGAITPAMEIARSVSDFDVRIGRLEEIPPLPVVHPNTALASQYVGPPDATFFRYLARRGAPVSR